MLPLNTIHHMDALSLMGQLDDGSVDAYITDLPYGTTACSWDVVIPFEPMWEQVKRTLKPNGVFVTTASQPFTTRLIASNLEMFKYEWIWNKVAISNFQLANKMPLKCHENIVVFSNGSKYYPQMVAMDKPIDTTNWKSNKSNEKSPIQFRATPIRKIHTEAYPKSIVTINSTSKECNGSHRLHPTQKPVALYEYLIKTYTQVGDFIIDPCCGSGTTALAARNLGRDYIASDTTREYVDISIKRLAQPYTLDMFIQQEIKERDVQT